MFVCPIITYETPDRFSLNTEMEPGRINEMLAWFEKFQLSWLDLLRNFTFRAKLDSQAGKRLKCYLYEQYISLQLCVHNTLPVHSVPLLVRTVYLSTTVCT